MTQSVSDDIIQILKAFLRVKVPRPGTAPAPSRRKRPSAAPGPDAAPGAPPGRSHSRHQPAEPVVFS